MITLLLVVIAVLVVLVLLRPAIRIPVVDRYLRKRILIRQQKKRLAQYSQSQQDTIKGLQYLQNFIDQMNQRFSNTKERKRFWKEFQDKKYRVQWFDKFVKQAKETIENIEAQKKQVGKKPKKVKAKKATKETKKK